MVLRVVHDGDKDEVELAPCESAHTKGLATSTIAIGYTASPRPKICAIGSFDEAGGVVLTIGNDKKVALGVVGNGVRVVIDVGSCSIKRGLCISRGRDGEPDNTVGGEVTLAPASSAQSLACGSDNLFAAVLLFIPIHFARMS